VKPAGAHDVMLRDGSTVLVRPATPDDVPAMRAFLAGLSQRARWFRFFSASLNVDVVALESVSPPDGSALLVLTGEPERIVAHALWARTGPRAAEVAFAVADDWQGRGLATTLLAHLAGAAESDGIEEFVAVTLPDNHRMIGVFRDSGFPVEVKSVPGELLVRLPTSLTEEGRRRFEARERDAAVAAVGHVLRPASVLVVTGTGATGRQLVHNLRGFAGTLREVENVEGIAAAPGPLELAVMALPAAEIPRAARACAERGDVRAMAVLGGEHGELGATDELLPICRSAGMRLLGPNSLGVVNTASQLDATYAPRLPPPGRVGFGTQSGASGIATLDVAARHGLGLSSFVSMGAKADLSGNDLLQFWEQDAGTDVVLLYLESFGNPRRFGRIARRVAAAKPVIVVKSGRTPPRPAADSQTGRLLAAADTSTEALFRHAGVIRTDTLAEMFDVAGLLTRQPAPTGNRVAIVTNAGGLGLQCGDACRAAGLRTASPVDLTAAASAGDYRREVAVALADPAVDAVVALFAQPLTTRAEDVAAALEDAVRDRHDAVPVLAVFLGADQPPAPGTVPVFAGPEEAARALAHAVAYARRRGVPDDPPPTLTGVDADRAAAIVATGLAAGGGWLESENADALLDCYGVPRPAGVVAPSPRAAARAAGRLGGPLAVKVLAAGLLHKSDIGSVRTGVQGQAAAERAAREVMEAAREAGKEPRGVLVQRMAPPGTELLVGVAGDPRFGPLIAVGAGGATAELIADVQVRLAPAGRVEASAMLRSLRTFPLLDGFRGRPRADLEAIIDVVLRIAALATAHAEIAELDCNPVVAGSAGALVVDARVRLEPPAALPPYAAVGRL
jgi:acyl-CoA synthetase (NDP forming)/GNAT superfamily N-acetyltransferase